MVRRQLLLSKPYAAAVLFAFCAAAPIGCQPLEQTDEPPPRAPVPAQPPAAAPQTAQCDEVKTKCAPQGGFPQTLLDACRAKYANADQTICMQASWPMELYNELNNAAAATASSECTDLYVSTTSDDLALREKPVAGATAIEWAPKGTLVCGLGNGGSDWTKVRYKGKIGYMSRQYLAVRSGGEAPAQSAQPTTPQTPAEKAGIARKCTAGKYACKVIKSNQNCWLKDPTLSYNNLPGVNDDARLVNTGQTDCFGNLENIRVMWGPGFMHRTTQMRWSTSWNCYVEDSNLECP
ncbi:SH3 domain-containing protein [bacterium]|nr:SH3 domain-containing protein [bacterium]